MSNKEKMLKFLEEYRQLMKRYKNVLNYYGLSPIDIAKNSLDIINFNYDEWYEEWLYGVSIEEFIELKEKSIEKAKEFGLDVK